MLNSISAAAGRLLLAEPFMLDPNFKRSVILLTEYSEEGVMGFVLNQQSNMLLGDVIPELSYSELPIFIGGPVSTDTLHFIHRAPDRIPGAVEIWDGIYWGGDFEMVKELISSYQLSENEIRFFIGYSGWSKEQLDTELNEDSWIVANNFNTDLIFHVTEQNLWREMIISLGAKYAHIANFPENPSLN